MSNLQELKSQFLVSDDLTEGRMLLLLEVAVKHCVVDSSGAVHIKNNSLKARDKIMLILIARLIASNLNQNIAAEVSAEELSKNAAVALDQVRARASDLIKEKMISTVGRGLYKAQLHKAEPFLRGLDA
jgi:hypothetical protein